MVKSQTTPQASKYNTLYSHLKEMEAICYGVRFEILVEPKDENQKVEGKRFIIKSQTKISEEDKIVTLNDQLNRIHQLQDYYTKMSEKANELLMKVKQEFSGSDFKISLVKRNVLMVPSFHFVFIEPQVIIKPLFSDREGAEKKMNPRFLQVEAVCEEEFFDSADESEIVKDKNDEKKMVELKELRASGRGRLLRRRVIEKLYQTTQL